MSTILRNTCTGLLFGFSTFSIGVSHADSARLINPTNGHQYQRFDALSSWPSARLSCEGKGAHLATLANAEEDNWVWRKLAANAINKRPWLGGTDELIEGDWRWVTGEPWGYSHWSPGEPNNDGPQNYLNYSYLVDSSWDDVYPQGDAGGYPYICEWETALVPFATFTPRAEFWLGPKNNDDSYWVRGWLKLARTSYGIDPLTEAVTIKVGSFSHTLPVGSFTQEGNSYLFKGPVGSSVLDVWITGSSIPGGYSFKSCLKNGNLTGTVLPPNAQLTIGDDQGQATLDVG